jgi:hypothetical protein
MQAHGISSGHKVGKSGQELLASLIGGKSQLPSAWIVGRGSWIEEASEERELTVDAVNRESWIVNGGA